jgi:hypothetical protein
MQIRGNGMLCILTDDDDDDDDDKAQWEYASNGTHLHFITIQQTHFLITYTKFIQLFDKLGRSKWQPFSVRANQELEESYRSGSIYGNGYVYTSEVEIYPSDINIGSYEIKGFSGSLVP